ncbi:MAG: hypothetical protein RDV48_11655 [Candidatus Eremiobacteraeota bacterium]|nr:hypothetical protein [Candidatus Eremiobacteraeota bacterium]
MAALPFKSVIAVIVIFACISCGCSTNSESARLKSDQERLRRENGELRKKALLVESENRRLSSEIKDNELRLEALKRRINTTDIPMEISNRNLEECKSNLMEISVAIKEYANTHKGILPKKLDMLLEGNKYLISRPVCPSAGKDTYSAGYSMSKDGKSFIVRCAGHNHKDKGIAQNLPQYSSKSGMADSVKQLALTSPKPAIEIKDHITDKWYKVVIRIGKVDKDMMPLRGDIEGAIKKNDAVNFLFYSDNYRSGLDEEKAERRLYEKLKKLLADDGRLKAGECEVELELKLRFIPDGTRKYHKVSGGYVDYWHVAKELPAWRVIIKDITKYKKRSGNIIDV